MRNYWPHPLLDSICRPRDQRIGNYFLHFVEKRSAEWNGNGGPCVRNHRSCGGPYNDHTDWRSLECGDKSVVLVLIMMKGNDQNGMQAVPPTI